MSKMARLEILILGLAVLTPQVIGQDCSITGNPGQTIDIFDISLSQSEQVITTFEILNAVEIASVTNQNMQQLYVSATLEGTTLNIVRTDNFAEYLENEIETNINLKIQFRCGSSSSLSSEYTITLYLLADNDNAPKFSEDPINLEIPLPLPMDFEVTFYKTISARDIDLNNQNVVFSGGNEYFTIGTIGQSATDPKEYLMSIKTGRAILSLPQDKASFSVTATDRGGKAGSTNIQIQVKSGTSYTPAPTFEKNSYHFVIDDAGELQSVVCALTAESIIEGEDVTFTLGGQDGEHFKIGQSSAQGAQVELVEPFDEAKFEGRAYLVIELFAARSGSDTGSTVIVVDLPNECAAVPCPEGCDDVDGPVFTQKLYTFTVSEGVQGELGKVEATLTSTLRYSLNYDDAPEWETILTIDQYSGILTLSTGWQDLLETSFSIEVIATTVVDDALKKGSSRIVLIKDDVCLAPHTVEKTLTFITVKEEQENMDIFPMTLGDCEYEILSYYPNDKEYFEVDENNRLNTIAIDRESETFKEMTVPQIQLKLKLVCASVTDNLLDRQRRAAGELFVDNVYTDEIAYASDITLLNVFIEDINDNSPVFINPAQATTHIGYPVADLGGFLMPPFLVQAVATDADATGSLTFALDSNSFFTIDPKSGIIFPLAQEQQVDIFGMTLSVSDGVHDENVGLFVHKLTAEHLVVIYVKDRGYHELDEVLATIHSRWPRKLQVLKYGNVAGEVTDTPFRRLLASLSMDRQIIGRTTAGANLKLIAYAFDDKDELLKAEDLVEEFEEIEGMLITVATRKFEDDIGAVFPGGTNEGTSSGTYVGVIIALGVLVLLLLGVGFIAWWFWIRPTEWKEIEETPSVSSSGQEEPPTSVATAKSIDEVKERPSLVLNGHTWTESSDLPTPQIIKNVAQSAAATEDSAITAVDPQPAGSMTPRQRKKSLTFNENVERIEIETEVPVTIKAIYPVLD